MKLKKWLAASAICALALAVGACGGKKTQKAADDWKPTKDIKVIVAYKAGSGTDTGARVLCKDAEKFVGKTLVIENKPGADGKIGWTELSKAKTRRLHHRLHQPAHLHHPGSGQECFL